MCGRYALAAGTEELVEAFEIPVPTFDLVSRYNIAPGQPAPVVAEDRHGRRMGLLTWGLVPGWVETPSKGLINARSETVMDKPSFREAFERQRCLVPADGFYEWRRVGSAKTPYWIYPTDGTVLAFAGIWERWSRPGREPLHTFAILTTASNKDVAPVHDRMPVIIPRSGYAAWLSRSTKPALLGPLLEGVGEGLLIRHEVSGRVNRPSADDPGLVEPVGSA